MTRLQKAGLVIFAAMLGASSLWLIPEDASAGIRLLIPTPKKDSGDFQMTKNPPDPPAINERRQWVFDLRWSRGEIFLLGTNPLELPAPQSTPRAIGRFAIELFEGPTLVERVRFDFPMLGAEPQDAGFSAPPSLERKLTTRIGVMFPATRRGTKLELVDRASGTRWPLPWPLHGNFSASDAARAGDH